MFYCCKPRLEPDGDDVCNRDSMPAKSAAALAGAFAAQLEGKSTTVKELERFTGPLGARIFGFQGQIAFCTCPSYPAARRCFHTLGLSLHLGKVELPESLDPTLLAAVSRTGAKRKAPGRGAVPLMADQKDLRIAQLEAQVRRMERQQGRVVVGSACKKKPAGATASQDPAPTAVRSSEALRRCRSKRAPPEAEVQAREMREQQKLLETQEDAEARELREQQNAVALVQDQLFMESDPTIGKLERTPPINPPRLDQELLVAANGRCLANCFVAAQSPEAWMQVPRKSDGTAAELEQVVKEDEWARDFLLNHVLAAGMPGDRVAKLLQGEYAEAEDIPHFAKAIAGSVGVVPPPGEGHLQGLRYYGDGPLKVKVGLYYLEGKTRPHYKLIQSWV